MQMRNEYSLTKKYFTMKKLSIFLFACLISSSCFAQEIDEDEYDANGNRTIITDEEEFSGDHEVRMIYYIPDGSEVPVKIIKFKIEDNGRMEKDRLLIVKFDDDSTLELKNRKDVFSRFCFPDMVIEPEFEVTNEQLDMLCNKIAVKVRFEQHNDLLDFKIKRNKLSKLLKQCRANLDAALKKKRDVRANF